MKHTGKFLGQHYYQCPACGGEELYADYDATGLRNRRPEQADKIQ
jgi:hypothetical protein